MLQLPNNVHLRVPIHIALFMVSEMEVVKLLATAGHLALLDAKGIVRFR